MASRCRISISIKHIQVTETLLATSVSNASPKLASVTLPCSVAWRGDRPDPSQRRFERNRIERAVVHSDRDTNGNYDSSIKLEVATSTRELHDSKVKSDEADETSNNFNKKVKNCSATSPKNFTKHTVFWLSPELSEAIVSRLRKVTKRILEPSWD